MKLAMLFTRNYKLKLFKVQNLKYWVSEYYDYEINEDYNIFSGRQSSNVFKIKCIVYIKKNTENLGISVHEIAFSIAMHMS